MGHSVLLCCASPWSSPSRLPRIFKKAGVDVSVFSAPRQLITLSRFIDTLVPAPLALDEYVDALRDHLAERSYDLVVLADDPLIDALRARRGEPWVDAILPIPGDNTWVGVLASKADFTLLAQAEDLPIPESRLCRTLADAEAAVNELGLPIMLKRSTSYAGLGVAKIERLDELPEIWRHLEGDVVVAQKFLSGIVGSSLAVFDHGVPLAWASAEKVRTWPGKFGPSTARRIVAHPAIGPAIARFGAATGYHGFGAFDWIIDEAGDFRFIEHNARATAMIRLGTAAGTDFSAAIRDLLAGNGTVRPPADDPDDRSVVSFFPEDIMRAVTEKDFTRDAVVTWFPRRGRYNDIPWQDPKVLAGYIQMSVANLVQRRRMRKQAR